MKRLLKFDFVRFCIVGALGFLINYSLLTIFYKKLDWPIFWAQLIAAEVALFSNFILHHYWTYKHKAVAKSRRNLLLQFHFTSWAAIVGSALMVSFGVHVLKLGYVVALMLSSGVALMWNFLWTKLVIWNHPPKEEEVSE